MNEFKFELVQLVEDKITGFKGTVTARCQYLMGTNTYQVTRVDGKGKTSEEWYQEPRLKHSGKTKA